MRFEYEYPVFVILERVTVTGDQATFHNLQTLDAPGGIKALAVFTDQAGAEDYRDKNCPGFMLVPSPDEEAFAGILVIATRAGITHVAFDPWKLGKGVQSVTIDELLKSMGRGLA